MELTDRSGYFAGPGMLGGSFGDASRASDEAAEGVADPCLTHEPDQVVFYELTRKFVETEEDVPQEACDVLYYTLAVGHHTGVLDCFEPRLSVPVNVFCRENRRREGKLHAQERKRCTLCPYHPEPMRGTRLASPGIRQYIHAWHPIHHYRG